MTYQEFTNRYEFNAKTDSLGQGSFGKVVKAYDNVLDKYVAIKIAEVKEFEGSDLSLKKELALLSSIPAQRNIANYEECFRFDNQLGEYDYAIMQYYPNGNLQQLIKTQNLTTHHLHQLVKGIVKGLEHIHKHNIIHRDLKPANILISERVVNGAKQYIPKITDFGLGKMVSGDVSQIGNSFAGGTFNYCSPEQLKGETLRKNTDLWSVGIILYELFTGKNPFNVNQSSNPSFNTIANSIIASQIPADIYMIEEPYQQMVKSCLEKDPNLRVKSAETLIDLLNNRPIKAEVKVEQTNNVAETQVQANSNVVKEPKVEVRNKSKERKLKTKKPLLIFAGLGVLAFVLAVFLTNNMYIIQNIKEAIRETEIAEDKPSKPLKPTKPIEPDLGPIEVRKPTSPVKAETSISFNSSSIDFGNVKVGDKPQYEFVFKNEGSSPLVISAARGSCGCLSVDWPQTAILPGENGRIKVIFDTSGKKGRQVKTVTVTSNTTPSKSFLKVGANVIP